MASTVSSRLIGSWDAGSFAFDWAGSKEFEPFPDNCHHVSAVGGVFFAQCGGSASLSLLRSEDGISWTSFASLGPFGNSRYGVRCCPDPLP